MYSTPWRAAWSSQLSLAPNGTSEDVNDELMEVSGLRSNSAGDLAAFLHSVVTDGTLSLAAILVFCVMRRLVPQVYAGNARKKEDGGRDTAPFVPCSTFFGWVKAGLCVSLEVTCESSGLDAALFLEFTEFAGRLLVSIGLPMIFIMCPLHYFLGGDRALSKGDRLSSIGLNNVTDGSWLFWVHAGIVWYVVVTAEELIFDSMARFLDHRFHWLLDFRPPQALTILVENIPPHYRSDSALKELFTKLFPHSVESAYLVKNTSKLKPIVESLKAKKLQQEILAYKKDHHRGVSLEPKQEEEMANLSLEVQELEVQAQMERLRIVRDVLTADCTDSDSSPRTQTRRACWRRKSQGLLSNAMRSVATSSGFVTFGTQRDAQIALHTRCTADTDEFVMSIPPHPDDIIYEDLQVPKFQQRIWTFLGGVMIFLLFWFFLPLVMIIASFTELEVLEQNYSFVHETLVNYPSVKPIIDGVLSTLALVLMMSFLPTLLMLIFNAFFSLKACAWAQLKLQRYYFGFLVAFVLLTTAIGSSIMSRLVQIYDHPHKIFGILGDALPAASHFYLDFLLVQMMQHAVALTRYVQVAKYWSFKAVLGEQRAIELSEPEDQDYYGIGARSARAALDLVIGIVFCSLCPLITVICLGDFLVARLSYGYLLVFAETRKTDLGGPFFVQQLWQVQFGLVLYAILMCSIFLMRAGHWGPLVIAAGTVPYLFYSMWRFQHAFVWENLPMMDICSEANMEEATEKMTAWRATADGHPPYMQHELIVEPKQAEEGSSPGSSSRSAQKEVEAPPVD